MILTALILHLLPMLCVCKIQINITVASNKHDTIVKFAGADLKLITDHEINVFALNPLYVMWAFRIELGRPPEGFYFKDPTPYGNLFHKFKWPEVKRKLHVENVFIDEIIATEVVLKTHEHVNNSTEDLRTDMSLFTEVENNAYSSWSEEGLPVEDTFYDVNIKINDKSLLKYTNKWRDVSMKAAYTKFGDSENGTMILKSGKGLIKKLTALKTIFVVNLEYKAQLVGNVIADYDKLYGKYHFYAPALANIMKAGEIRNDIRTKEKIEIRCYTNPKVEFFDRDTGARINFHKRRKVLFKSNEKKFLPDDSINDKNNKSSIVCPTI